MIKYLNDICRPSGRTRRDGTEGKQRKMRKAYRMTIAGLERDLPLCPIGDSLQIGAFVIFGDPELTTACAAELLRRAPEYDYLITAEAKGIPLVHEMARLAGNQKYFLARKKPKLYMTGVMEVRVRSITTEGEQKITYRCLVFSYLEKNSKGKEKEIVTFYITDDDNHIPVRLDLNLRFGIAKAYLKNASGLRNPQTSIIEQ